MCAGHVWTDSGFHLDTIPGEVLVPTRCMFANCPWAVSLGHSGTTRKLWCHFFATYQPTYTQITRNCRTRGYVSPGRFSQWVWALSLIFIGFADLQLNVPFVVTGSDTVHSFYRLSSLFSVSRSFLSAFKLQILLTEHLQLGSNGLTVQLRAADLSFLCPVPIKLRAFCQQCCRSSILLTSPQCEHEIIFTPILQSASFVGNKLFL